MRVHNKEVCYLILIKPKIEIEDRTDVLYSKLRNLYCLEKSLLPIKDLINYTDFKNIKDKLYLCLILMVSHMEIPKDSLELLYEKLSYYGNTGVDIKNIKNDIKSSRDIETFCELLLTYIYELIVGKHITRRSRFENISELIIQKYKTFL